jgi:protein SCO1/2
MFFVRGLRAEAKLGLLAGMMLAGSGVVLGQGQYSAEKPVGTIAQQMPAYLKHAGIEQRLNQELPLGAVVTDESGKVTTLGSYFGKRPVVMALMYYKCVMLCPEVLKGLASGLKQVTLTPGKDYDVVIFSIDPGDTPKDAMGEKERFLEMLGNPGAAAATHVLTEDPASIAAISGATGFNYVMVPGPDGKMDQYAHSSVIMFATPGGRLSKYISGIDYPARDLRMALLEASEQKISNPADLVLLYCCSYDPVVGKYSVSVLRILGLAGMGALVIMAGMIFLLTRKPQGRMAA